MQSIVRTMLTAFIVVSLCFLGAHGEYSSLLGNIVQMGLHCVEVAQDVIESVDQSNAEQAIEHLLSLQTDAWLLEDKARSRIKHLERERDDLQEQFNGIEGDIAVCKQTETYLLDEIESAKNSLVTEQMTQKVNQDLVKAAKEEHLKTKKLMVKLDICQELFMQ